MRPRADQQHLTCNDIHRDNFIPKTTTRLLSDKMLIYCITFVFSDLVLTSPITGDFVAMIAKSSHLLELKMNIFLSRITCLRSETNASTSIRWCIRSGTATRPRPDAQHASGFLPKKITKTKQLQQHFEGRSEN